MRNTVTLFHCFYRSSLNVLVNGQKSLKFNSWDFFMLSKHYILRTTINEDTTSSHLVKTDHQSWGNHMIAVEGTFFAKDYSFKAIFQSIAHSIWKVLTTIRERCYLHLTTLILNDLSYWQVFLKWLVASYTIIQFCLFKTNKRLTKY